MGWSLCVRVICLRFARRHELDSGGARDVPAGEDKMESRCVMKVRARLVGYACGEVGSDLSLKVIL